MTAKTNCPSKERLLELLKGALSSDEQERLAEHLEQCAACQQALNALAGDDKWVRHSSTPPSPDSDALRRVVEDLKARSPVAIAPQATPPTVDFLLPTDKPGYIGRFGPYDIVEVVAGGGMGMVLKGHDPVLNRIVAIKVLSPALAANATARQRFLREARAAAAVTHDHVVTIHAVDEANNLPYLVMQFVAGRSLEARIKATGPLSLEETLRVGRQIALGLAAAHAQGLIHRDIKPGNILLENSIERVKITDFGLARAMDESGVTQSGCISGTPEFMAPEQARGEPVDTRADLFSLGCVLYAMGTGHSPFHGGSVIAVIRKVCDSQPPPVHEVNKSVPSWFGEIVTRLMAKSPPDRYQSAAEVATLLEQNLARVHHGAREVSAGASIVSAPASARLRRNGTRVLRASFVLAAVAAVLFVAIQPGWIPIRRPAMMTPVLTNTPPSESPPAPVLPKGAIVLLPNSGDATGRSFNDLAEAIAAAAVGDTIELRFSVTLTVERLRIDKALILRAGDGFQPVVANGSESDTLILSEAPLVIEGIELRSWAANGGTPPRPPPRHMIGMRLGGPPEGQASNRDAPPWLILARRAPLLVVHCRLAGGGREIRKTIEVTDADHCAIWHSEMYDTFGRGPAMAFTLANAESSRTEPARLTVRNCVHHGGAAVLVSQSPELAAAVELSHNTFGGRSVLRLERAGAVANLAVQASSNHFGTSQLVQAGARPIETRPEGMRWQDQHNLFNAFVFMKPEGMGGQFQGSARNLAEWEQQWGQSNTASRVLNSGLNRRLTQGVESGQKLAPRDFSLREETNAQALAQQVIPGLGAAVERVGPGAVYDRWRKSEEYATWTAMVRQVAGGTPQKAAVAR